jgi:GntR family transcriptional regulator
VREVRRLVRESHARDMRNPPGPTSPFARDAQRAGHEGGWEHHSEHTTAPDDIARRLAVEPGEPVMVTRYRFLADGAPIQLSRSWEPLSVTGGTPVEWPEDGAAVGVVARMDTIGVRIDECTERVTARPARPDEIDALGLPLRGSYVLVVERTYYADGRPLETADIVFPGDRYELVYRYPIG